MTLRRYLEFCLVLLVALAGCSAPGEQRKILPMVLQDFNEAISWNHYDLAGSFAPPTGQGTLTQHLRSKMAGIHIVEVESLATSLDPDGQRALCKVRISWYSDRNPTVTKGIEIQEWVRINGRWWLIALKPPSKAGDEASPFVNIPEAGNSGMKVEQ
jgi:hypothetical protein